MFNFGADNNGDYLGSSSTSSNFGGETTASGGQGGVGATHGGIWGYTAGNWHILYILTLGNDGGAFNNRNGYWFKAGGINNGGLGKQTYYDTLPIDKIAFTSHTSLFTPTSGTPTAHLDSGYQSLAVADIPGAPRTLLNYISSFGVNETSDNIGT